MNDCILSLQALALLFALIVNFNFIENFIEFTLSLKIKLHFELREINSINCQ